MPLWAFDQVIVTPEGEPVPDLTVTDLSALGFKRKGRLKEYKKEIADLQLRPGPTYTFCFWGISQFLDKLKWQLVSFGPALSLTKFHGAPPIHVVAYILKDKTAIKHYDYLKEYFLCTLVWSSAARPSKAVLQSMLSGEFAQQLIGAKRDATDTSPKRSLA